MKAWRLTMADGSFTCSDVPVPAAREGSVLIRMQASPLLSYLRSFVTGELTSYGPPPGEFTPGTNGVGVIERTRAPASTGSPPPAGLPVPARHGTENVPEPAEALIGLTAEPGSAALLSHWPDGTLAEFALMPAAAVTPVPAVLARHAQHRPGRPQPLHRPLWRPAPPGRLRRRRIADHQRRDGRLRLRRRPWLPWR